MIRKILIGCLFVLSMEASGQNDAKMNAFITNLMNKMTLDEKLGQLNLPGAGDITTGQASSSDIAKKIKEGKVGGLFNIKSVEKIREVQRIAMETSRLKIPLIFGMDVIHGYQTTFPIPLGLSASWNLDAIERSGIKYTARDVAFEGIAGFMGLTVCLEDLRRRAAEDGIELVLIVADRGIPCPALLELDTALPLCAMPAHVVVGIPRGLSASLVHECAFAACDSPGEAMTMVEDLVRELHEAPRRQARLEAMVKAQPNAHARR